MKRLLTSTAVALALAAPAIAENENATGQMFDESFEQAQGFKASDLIGARLYASEAEIDSEQPGMNADWEDVGEIHDIVLGKDGEVDYLIADIGGFLGLGEKSVAVNMNELTFVSDGSDASDYFIVISAAKADLETAPAYGNWEQTSVMPGSQENGDTAQNMNEAGEGTDQATAETGSATENPTENATMGTEETATAPTAETGETGTAGETGSTAEIHVEGYETQATADVTVEEITGSRVYDARNEWVGEIGELVMADNGTDIGEVVVDVGGFLGIGEKPVALDIEDLTIKSETDGDDLRVYLDKTKEELEAMPEYEAS